MNLLESSTSAQGAGCLMTIRGAADGTGVHFYGGGEGVMLFHDQASDVLGSALCFFDIQSWHLDEADEMKFTAPALWNYFLDVSPAKDFAITKTKRAMRLVELLDSATMLGRTRHYLGLNTSELAEAMRVERPTVYAWLDGGKIRAANKERLATVYALAAKWWKLCPVPLGPSLHFKSEAGASIHSLLCAEVIAEAEFGPLFDHLATGLKQEKRPAGGGFDSFAKRAAARGLAQAPKHLQRQSIRKLSGPKEPG